MAPALESLLDGIEPPATGSDSLEGERLRRAVRARLLDETVPETRIDRYVVRERLGVGGMGVVYAAHDPELDREVAIKLVRHWDSPERETEQQRLIREARALAQLSHPHVVEIYDVAMHGDRVFLVMERIRGATLRRRLAERTHSWQEIVACFAQAGAGLAAAHGVGIVHRDFKPDNAFVGEDGRVRVLDFGLALGDGTSPGTPSSTGSGDLAIGSLTATGKLVGTPAYMAPEQFIGAPADARTDQFSFCVALWEALFGQRPYPADNLTQLRHVLADGEIAAPADPGHVPPWLRRAIERGLALDPERRWPSMRALLDACARPPRRRGWWWPALGLSTVTITAAVSTWRWDQSRRRAACASDASELAAAWNPEVAREVGDAFVATGVGHAGDTAARLDARLTAYADQWAATHAAGCIAALSRELDASSWQRRQACLDQHRERLAILVEILQRPDREVVNAALRVAHDLPSAEGCDDPSGPSAHVVDRDAGSQLRHQIMRARLLAEVARPEALDIARTARDEALALADSVVIADAEIALAMAHARRGDYGEAAAAYERAYFAAEPNGADELALLAATQLVDTLGYRLSRVDDGLAWARHAEALLARGRERPWQAAELAHRQATVLHVKGNNAAARADYERAIALRTREAGPDHPAVGRDWSNLGNLLAEIDAPDDASLAYDEADRIFSAALGPASLSLVAVYDGRARIAQSRGDFGVMVDYAGRALALNEELLGPEHPRVATALSNLATAKMFVGEHDEALRLFRRAVELRRALLGSQHLQVAASLANLAVLELHVGALEDARMHLDEALTIRRALLPPRHIEIANVLITLGEVMLAEHDFERALAHFDEALVMTEQQDGRSRRERVRALSGIGMARLELGRPAHAITALTAALVDSDDVENDPVARCDLRHTLARALLASGSDRRQVSALARDAEALCRRAGERAKVHLDALSAWARGDFSTRPRR